MRSLQESRQERCSMRLPDPCDIPPNGRSRSGRPLPCVGDPPTRCPENYNRSNLALRVKTLRDMALRPPRTPNGAAAILLSDVTPDRDRTSVVEGKGVSVRVDLGGRRF